jgi:transcriptional regulator with XRE-family HTH domain
VRNVDVIEREIAYRIRISREDRGFTRRYFAEIVDVSERFMCDLENAKCGMSLTTFIKVYEALNVRPDYLLLGDDDKSAAALYLLQQMKEENRQLSFDILETILKNENRVSNHHDTE